MSNPNFKQIHTKLYDAAGEVDYFKFFTFPGLKEKTEWSEEESAVLAKVERLIQQATAHLDEALAELDANDEWGEI